MKEISCKYKVITEDITEDQLSRTGILLHGEQDFLTTIPNIDNGLVE